jgi:hypothetical protein
MKRSAGLGRSRAWRIANPGRYAANTIRRHPLIERQTLTPAERDRIATVYAEAARLTRETGTKHRVEHIIPLRNPYVCGLHRAINLEISICLEKNRRRPPRHRLFTPAGDTELFDL